ncbi:MAG TPA: hypothetical protein VD794_06995, partial [Flavisolibacter sp.]|nr:hypothetical protein [Flavisolibacter sp.]
MANQNDYIIPFAIDPKSVLSGIQVMDDSIETLVATSKQANEEIQKSFNESAINTQKLKSSILENINAAKAFKAEIEGGTTPSLQQFQKVNTALATNLETLRLKLSQATDPKQAEALTKQISFLDNQMKALKATFDKASAPNFAPAINIIERLETEMLELGKQIKASSDPIEVKKLIATYKELESQLLKQRAAVYSNAQNLSDLKKPVKDANFVLTDFNRIIQDAPFGFIGIQNNIGPAIDSFTRLRKETGTTGGALKALGSSLVGAGGIGFAVSILTSALTFASIGLQAWGDRASKSKKAIDEAKEANEKYVEGLDGVRKALLQGRLEAEKELTTLRSLYTATQNTALSQEQRIRAVDSLQEKYPDYFKNLTDEEILAGKGAKAYGELTTAIIASARARAAQDLAVENQRIKLTNEDRIISAQKEIDLTNQQLKAFKERNREVLNSQNLNTGDTRRLQVLSEIEQVNAKIAERQKTINTLRTQNNKLDQDALRLSALEQQQIAKGGDGDFDQSKAEEAAAKKRQAAIDKANKEREAKEEAFNKIMQDLIQEREQ